VSISDIQDTIFGSCLILNFFQIIGWKWDYAFINDTQLLVYAFWVKKHACNILGAQNQTIAWQNIKRQLADSRRAQPNKMINNIAAKQHSRRSKSNNNAIFAILVTSNQTIERYYSWENAQQRVTGIAFSSLSNINLRTKQIAVPRRKCPN
jgi:hypothetical protein